MDGGLAGDATRVGTYLLETGLSRTRGSIRMHRARLGAAARLALSQLAFGWVTIGERLTSIRPYAWAGADTVRRFSGGARTSTVSL